MNVKEFKFDKEGHTLGNMLQMKLLEMGVHAAYKVPHPLKNEMHLLVFGDEPDKKIKEAKKSLLADITEFELAFKQAQTDCGDTPRKPPYLRERIGNACVPKMV